MDELRSRERYLSLVNMTIRDALNPTDLADRYYYLTTHLVNLFVADHAHIVHWDATRNRASIIASTSRFEQLLPEVVFDLSESKLIALAFRTGHVLVVDNVPNSEYASDPSLIVDPSPQIQSVLCIPLKAGENKLGVVIIVYDTQHHFTPKEIERAELTGNQISLVFYTIQQELKIQKQLKEGECTRQHRARSWVKPNGWELKRCSNLSLTLPRKLIPGAEHAVLHLLDTEKQILEPRAVAGFSHPQQIKLNMRPGEGIAGRAMATGKVILVADTRNDPRFLNQATDIKFRSLVVAPIHGNEKALGTISVQSELPSAFSVDESNLLGDLGTQAAIAIENANLLEATQQDLKEINALYHGSRGLVASLDPDQLMKDVADLLQKNFGYYHVQIYLVDPENGDLPSPQG